MFRPHGGHHRTGVQNILTEAYMAHYETNISLLTVLCCDDCKNNFIKCAWWLFVYCLFYSSIQRVHNFKKPRMFETRNKKSFNTCN